MPSAPKAHANKKADAEKKYALSIYVPEGGAVDVMREGDDSVENQSLKDWIPGFGRVAEVDGGAVEAQWRRTIDTLMKLTSSVGDRAKDWTIEEVEVGLTLSAKGELLFIAEAGAEASIKLLLKRQPDGATADGKAVTG